MQKDLKTIGDKLKQKRESLGLSLGDIEKELKIKKAYLNYLEENKFHSFYSKTQAKGFIKNYSRFLGLNHEMMVALYRRDFENINMQRKIKKVKEEKNDKKNYFSNIVIKKIHLTSFIVILILLLSSLFVFNTLRKTFSNPELILTEPFEIKGPYKGRIAYDKDEITLKGQIERGSSILINSVPVEVNSDFSFESKKVPITEDNTVLTIVSENSLGAKSEINLELYKSNKTIEFFNIFISTNTFIESLIVKSDGIVKFEGSFSPSNPIDIAASKNIEVISPKYNNLFVRIFDKEYKLESENTVFRNIGTEIKKE